MDSKLICYLCCICLLWSCEYKIHENFVDIEEPQDSANASIDLNAVTDGPVSVSPRQVAVVLPTKWK